jgi:hypothetical protein
MQRIVKRSQPVSSEELYNGLLFGTSEDDYSCFIDRKDISYGTFSPRYSEDELREMSFRKLRDYIG